MTALHNKGNTFWDSNSIRLYTTLYGATSNYVIISNTASMPKLTYLSAIDYDNIKELFGNSYRWDMSQQVFRAPATGLYRLTSQVYFLANTKGINYRTYWQHNEKIKADLEIASFIDIGKPISVYISNTYSLKKTIY